MLGAGLPAPAQKLEPNRRRWIAANGSHSCTDASGWPRSSRIAGHRARIFAWPVWRWLWPPSRIAFTGNHDPAPPRTATAPNVAALAPDPEQLRTYQRRLEAADTRPQSPASLQELRPAPPATDDRGVRDQGSTRAQDPIAEERRRREYESLFATNVVQSPTLATTEPTRSASPRRTTPGMAGDSGATRRPRRRGGGGGARLDRAHERRSAGRRWRRRPPWARPRRCRHPSSPRPTVRCIVCVEGTIVDTILTNRLMEAAAPVNRLVSTPIYSTDQQVLIPAGA